MEEQMNQDKLILDNMPLVSFIVKRYYRAGAYEWEELKSEGMVGLVKAARIFRPEEGNKFSTLAATCIRNQLFEYFRSNNKHLKVDSLDRELISDGEGRGITYADIISDPEDCFEQFEDLMVLTDILGQSKQKELLCCYYGIGCEPMKQVALAQKYGVSQAAVARRLKQAVNEMKECHD